MTGFDYIVIFLACIGFLCVFGGVAALALIALMYWKYSQREKRRKQQEAEEDKEFEGLRQALFTQIDELLREYEGGN